MTTADWALIISLCSLLVSLAGFVWNVWSKFIYPKPKVSMAFLVRAFATDDVDSPQFLALSATNHGPGAVTLHNAVGRTKKRFGRKQAVFLNPLHNFPIEQDFTIGPFSGGLPKKLDVGESFSSYFPMQFNALNDLPLVDVGFVDTFGRCHWAPRQQVKTVRREVAKAL